MPTSIALTAAQRDTIATALRSYAEGQRDHARQLDALHRPAQGDRHRTAALEAEALACEVEELGG